MHVPELTKPRKSGQLRDSSAHFTDEESAARKAQLKDIWLLRSRAGARDGVACSKASSTRGRAGYYRHGGWRK